MIKHLVFWKLNPELEREDALGRIAVIRERLEALVGVVPGLRHIEVGLDFSESDASFDVALYSELDSREALAGYQVHPDHVAVVGLARECFAERAVVDYEV